MLVVPRISDKSKPWLAILVEYGFKNEPFVLGSWATEDWKARKLWTTASGDPNIEYLKKCYGSAEVPIYSETSGDYTTTTFSHFLANLESRKINPQTYLKDWHFQNMFGTSMYNLHPFFTRDWVNCESWSYSEDNPFGDDYRFVYFGTSGSWTKFHSDVVSSHSWSANICGRKLWHMVPPGNEKFFRLNKNEFIEDIRKAPEFWEKAGVITFIQQPGEIVFVPTNWYHQVHNLSDTISINHNWINSTNIEQVVNFVKTRQFDVINEISHCSDMFSKEEMNKQIELVLFADARLNKARLKSLLVKVEKSRKDVVDRPYICSEHGINVLKCFRSAECRKNIESICNCSTSFCRKCYTFINSFELSISTFFLDVD